MNKTVSTSFTILCLLCTSFLLGLSFNVQTVKADGTIFIRADGSIDPPTAPIQRDGDVYTLTNDIYDSIMVEKYGITIDGAGYEVHCLGDLEAGFILNGTGGVTIKNTYISGFTYGIQLYSSLYNDIAKNNITNNEYGIMISLCDGSRSNIFRNNITNNDCGILLSAASTGASIYENNIADNIEGIRFELSSTNTIHTNNVTNNWYGIVVSESDDNKFYHNNFIDNLDDVYDLSWVTPMTFPSVNIWDNGYPSGGNYWDRYDWFYMDLFSGPYQNQPGSDGICDEPIYIYEDNEDRFALITPTYVQLFYFYLTITSGEEGKTNPPSGTYGYVEENQVRVTAIPDSGYSFNYWLLDGEEMTENPTLVSMDANHTMEAFFVDDISPEISFPIQEPSEDITSYESVMITVNVTDLGVGIHNVTLWYSTDNGTIWAPLNMLEISNITYQTMIPGHKDCTWITYKITAYDNNENQAIDDNNGYYYSYHVIPEFPSLQLMSLLMIVTLVVVILSKKREIIRTEWRR